MHKLLLLLALLSQHGFQSLLALTGCGQPLVSGRIVGGENAAIGEWPWQVSLQYDNSSICGGSLISDSWVMTSAHCFDTPVNLSEYTIYLGVYQLLDLHNPRVVVRGMKQVIIHPNYVEEGSIGDIALIELEKPVNFTSSVLPVCLPSKSVNIPDKTLCWATGWGDIHDGVPLAGSKTLHKVQLALIENKRCESMYQTSLGYSPKFKLIKTDMFCAGYKNGKKDACQGDSGGPLVCKVNSSWVQVGIVSWGFGCGEPNYPGVYTSVQYYMSWIGQYVMHKENSNALKMDKLTQNRINNQFVYHPKNSNLTYISYEQNYTESRNLTDNSDMPMVEFLVGNGAHSALWSMVNAMLILLGLVLLL